MARKNLAQKRGSYGQANQFARAQMVEKNFDPLDELIYLLTNKRKVAEMTVNEHANLLLKCMAFAYPKLRQVEHQMDNGSGEIVIQLGGIHDQPNN